MNHDLSNITGAIPVYIFRISWGLGMNLIWMNQWSILQESDYIS